MIADLPRWMRMGLALSLMVGAGIVTLAVFLVTRSEDSNDVETATSEVAVHPLVVQTDIQTETQTEVAILATHTPTLTPSAEQAIAEVGITFTPTLVPTLTPASAVASPTIKLPDAAVVVVEGNCPHPAEWVAHTVQAGETLFAYQLGAKSAVTVDQIMAANCIDERLVYEGQVIWLPPGAAENAPSSYVAPTAIPVDPNAAPPPDGLTRTPNCPCELTIRAGWRLEQIGELIDSLPVGFRSTDFLNAARNASAYSRDFLVGVPAGVSLEGFMLPGTYTVTNDMGARSFIEMVLDAFGTIDPQMWVDGGARGFTPYQIVTLASIINKESGSYEQQLLVSSVFHNRLKAGNGLGATVTTQYAVGRPGDWWPNVHGLVATYDSPYNTNLYAGLPPSPIASPTLDAIRAAVYPADTAFMYFTGSCDGSGNAYAVTYDEHLANVRCE